MSNPIKFRKIASITVSNLKGRGWRFRRGVVSAVEAAIRRVESGHPQDVVDAIDATLLEFHIR